jgi:hypothetical protein
MTYLLAIVKEILYTRYYTDECFHLVQPHQLVTKREKICIWKTSQYRIYSIKRLETDLDSASSKATSPSGTGSGTQEFGILFLD